MKTWTLQTIAVAVAAGRSLFEKYHVTSPGPVLYLAGEGGRSTFANRHQVIAARYYIDPETLRDLPFGAEFGVGALDNSEFTEAVKRHLDTLQPKLVILDPLYAYHPSDVEVSNLYARGPMLANLRALIGDEAALIVGDHFNKTAPERLDLDNVARRYGAVGRLVDPAEAPRRTESRRRQVLAAGRDRDAPRRWETP